MTKTKCVLDIMEKKKYISIETNYSEAIPTRKIAMWVKSIPDQEIRSKMRKKIVEKIKSDEDYIYDTTHSEFYCVSDIKEYISNFIEMGVEQETLPGWMTDVIGDWVNNHYPTLYMNNGRITNLEVRKARLQEAKDKSNEALNLLNDIL